MKGVFKYAKGDDERTFGSVKNSSLGMPPCTPKKYPRRPMHLSLGMPPCIPYPSIIISSSFSMLYFYHFRCYVLNLALPALYLLVCLVLLVVHKKLDPSPLPPRTQHRFACLYSCVCSLSFHRCCQA